MMKVSRPAKYVLFYWKGNIRLPSIHTPAINQHASDGIGSMISTQRRQLKAGKSVGEYSLPKMGSALVSNPHVVSAVPILSSTENKNGWLCMFFFVSFT